jgi:hypothetical protein
LLDNIFPMGHGAMIFRFRFDEKIYAIMN